MTAGSEDVVYPFNCSIAHVLACAHLLCSSVHLCESACDSMLYRWSSWLNGLMPSWVPTSPRHLEEAERSVLKCETVALSMHATLPELVP